MSQEGILSARVEVKRQRGELLELPAFASLLALLLRLQ
jgi:hypothetical protein